MKELEQAIQKVFADMVTTGALTKLIESHVQKAVDSVLSDCFRSYSPFQKALGDHINKTLRVDYDDLGLAGYNQMLLTIIKTKLDASVFKFAEKQISEGLDELLKSPPKEIKLSELVRQFAQESREEDDSLD